MDKKNDNDANDAQNNVLKNPGESSNTKNVFQKHFMSSYTGSKISIKSDSNVVSNTDNVQQEQQKDSSSHNHSLFSGIKKHNNNNFTNQNYNYQQKNFGFNNKNNHRDFRQNSQNNIQGSYNQGNYNTNQQNNFNATNKKNVFDFNSLNKKERFEQFLTYQKRLTRLALCQAYCSYEFNYEELDDEQNFDLSETGKILKDPRDIQRTVKSIIYVYKNLFFVGRYGPIERKKKLDEKWLYDSFNGILQNRSDLDQRIIQSLNKKWKINDLYPIIRTIFRCAVYEMMFTPSTSKKIIISEYVKLCGAFFDDAKTIGFVNGVLDNISKKI
jgi:transcription antitermination factor NusB